MSEPKEFYSRVVQIDSKFAMYTDANGMPQLAKRVPAPENEAGYKLEPIPHDEPVIVFRARDRLALRALEYYRGLCQADGCTKYQLDGMDEILQRFREFAAKSDQMKQPGVTEGMFQDPD